jgi:hypothetical protein
MDPTLAPVLAITIAEACMARHQACTQVVMLVVPMAGAHTQMVTAHRARTLLNQAMGMLVCSTRSLARMAIHIASG